MLLLRTIFNFIIFVKRIERVEIVRCHFFYMVLNCFGMNGFFCSYFLFIFVEWNKRKVIAGKTNIFFVALLFFRLFLHVEWQNEHDMSYSNLINCIYHINYAVFLCVCISFVVINHLIQSHIFKFDVIFHRNVLKINKIMCISFVILFELIQFSFSCWDNKILIECRQQQQQQQQTT